MTRIRLHGDWLNKKRRRSGGVRLTYGPFGSSDQTRIIFGPTTSYSPLAILFTSRPSSVLRRLDPSSAVSHTSEYGRRSSSYAVNWFTANPEFLATALSVRL
jgi:hypothetical protein